MKNMRKLLAVLLTFVMAFSLCSVAMAEEGALVASDDLRTTTYTDARGLTVPVKPTGIAVTVTPAGGTSENATFYKDVYQTSNTYNLSTATYICRYGRKRSTEHLHRYRKLQRNRCRERIQERSEVRGGQHHLPLSHRSFGRLGMDEFGVLSEPYREQQRRVQRKLDDKQARYYNGCRHD